jgi:hypothetical protein
MRAFRLAAGALPIVLAVALSASAFAQQAPAPAPKPSAPKPAAPNTAAPKPAAPKTVPPGAAPSGTAPSAGAGGNVQPTLLGQYGDWGAYTASPGGKKICFALARPKTSQTEPAGRPRDQSYMFVSSRPAEHVKNEVSVIIGYPFKSSSDATAEVGGSRFAMYTQSDGAWIKNLNEEARMVDAMRKATDVTVKGTSGRGTQSVDQYSLKGLAQALDRIDKECR